MATSKNQKDGKNSQPPVELEPAPAAHVELAGILNEVTADTFSITFAQDMTEYDKETTMNAMCNNGFKVSCAFIAYDEECGTE